MTEETPITEVKSKSVPVSSKKATPKPKKVKSETKANRPNRSMTDVSAKDRRVAFVKLLRKHRADKTTSAMAISKISEKLNYTSYDVYCLGYHKNKLAVEGIVKSVKNEGDKQLSFYLTAKGMKSETEIS